jgi:hypothetical protein
MVFDHKGNYPSHWAVICSISGKCPSRWLHNWLLCRPDCSDRVHAPFTGNRAIRAMVRPSRRGRPDAQQSQPEVHARPPSGSTITLRAEDHYPEVFGPSSTHCRSMTRSTGPRTRRSAKRVSRPKARPRDFGPVNWSPGLQPEEHLVGSVARRSFRLISSSMNSRRGSPAIRHGPSECQSPGRSGALGGGGSGRDPTSRGAVQTPLIPSPYTGRAGTPRTPGVGPSTR